MCRRPAGKHLGGLWEFPGGKVEEGEHFPETLIRELKEELDVTVEVGGALQPVEWKDESVNLRLRPFFCKISRGTPVALEHQALKWCGVSEVFSLELAPADVPILQEIRYLDARM
jgi:8-oxo-dGTP diphosphatase